MPGISGAELASLAVQIAAGVAIGSILMNILQNAINPIIIFVIIIVTIIAILDFAEYLPAFSIAFFTGYVVEFLFPFAAVFDGLEIAVLALALVGLGVVVGMKVRQKGNRQIL